MEKDFLSYQMHVTVVPEAVREAFSKNMDIWLDSWETDSYVKL